MSLKSHKISEFLPFVRNVCTVSPVLILQ